MTWRWTESGLPAMRAPAAAAWPPPPNWREISLTLIAGDFERRLMRIKSVPDLLEDARDHHRFDGADMVDQTLRVARGPRPVRAKSFFLSQSQAIWLLWVR